MEAVTNRKRDDMTKQDAPGGTNDKPRRDDHGKSGGEKISPGKKGKKGEKPKKEWPRTPTGWAIAVVRWLWPVVVLVVVVFGLRSSLIDWNDVPSGSMQPTIIVGDRIFVNKLSYDLKVPFTLWRVATWDTPRRGDIVVWLHPTEHNWAGKTRLVKRVIGLPGDVIELRDCSTDPATPGMAKLIINGKEATYTPATQPESTKGQLQPLDMQHHFRFYTENLDGVEHLVAFFPPVPSAKLAVDAHGNPILDEWGNRAFRGVIRSFGPFTVPEGKYFLMGDNRDQSRDSRYFDSIGYAIPGDHILGRSSRVVFSLHDNWVPRGSRFFHEMP